MDVFQIFVATVVQGKHRTLTLNVTSATTGREIMLAVLAVTGDDKIRLLFAGRRLDADDTVASRNLAKESTLHSMSMGAGYTREQLEE